MELEVVVGGAGVGAVLTPDLFTGMEGEHVDLQGEFAVEVFCTNGAFEGREGHVVSSGSGNSVIDRLDGDFVDGRHQGRWSFSFPHFLGRSAGSIALTAVSQVVGSSVSVHVPIGGEGLTTNFA